MLKRVITIVLFGVLLFGVAAITIYLFPRTIQFTENGIKYQLGEQNADIVLPVEVTVDGKLTRKLNGNRVFSGKIHIPELELPIPDHAELIDIQLGEDVAGVLVYSYFENNTPYLYNVGRVFFNEKLNELTVLLSSKESEGRSSWLAEDGMMLSAPATTRDEALALSNKLMKLEALQINPLR